MTMTTTSSLNMNSGIHQLPSNCYPPSDSDDDDSFVVLSNSLGPDVLRDSVLRTEPISTNIVEASLESVTEVLAQVNLLAGPNGSLQADTTVDGAASTYSSTEFSPEEIQRKVDQLIAENTRLKDTLAQNNIAMKKQVETLSQWQQDVQRVQESHKEKFAEMKKYISILKAENVLLKNASALSESKVFEETKQTASETVPKKNKMDYELEASKKKIEELEKALDMLSLEKEKLLMEYNKVPNSSLVCKLKELTDINEKLVIEIEKREADKIAFEKDYINLKCQTADINRDHEELNKQNSTLSIEKQQAEEIISDMEKEIENLCKANNDLKEKLDVMKNEYDSNLQKLIEEIRVLKNANKESANFQEILSNMRQQLMASQMHITELKQQNARVISEKNDEIKDLQNQLKISVINEDELTALRAQVELYKNDFEIERHSKEEILLEKNKLVEDLSHLQRRNEQLLTEVEQLRSGFVCIEREEATATSPPPNNMFACPKCSFKFSNYQALENHVYRCIDLDRLP